MMRFDERRPWRVGLILAAVCAAGGVVAEPVPLFFKGPYGDARDDVAAVPRKFRADDPAWQPALPRRGCTAGETTVVIHFPTPARSVPVRFGVPLGQLPSAANVAVFDERQRPLRADVFPLVNFDTARQHWVLVTIVLDAPAAGDRQLNVRWGPDIRRPEPGDQIAVRANGGGLSVRGPRVAFDVSVAGLLGNLRGSGTAHSFAPHGCHVGLRHAGKSHTQGVGRVVRLFDGPLYQRVRVESTVMNDQLKLHFDVETWADSPYVLVSSRFINESTSPRPVSDLTLLSIRPSEPSYAIAASGPDDESLRATRKLTIGQRVDEWSVTADGEPVVRGIEDNLGSWLRTTQGAAALTFVVPDFQGFGPGDPDLESRLVAANTGAMTLLHYTPVPPGTEGRIIFWDTAARTFRVVLHLGAAADAAAAVAAPAHDPPSIRFDRQFLTDQGLFSEDRVTGVYDEPALAGARYFGRTRAHRHDYPRMGRGMPPPKGEGFEHPYTDTGGMLFGEVWQYTSTQPGRVADAVKRARVPAGNLPGWYRPQSNRGISTYRCGDQTLAIALSYLRTGDREVFEVFRDHPLQYADLSIAHPEGYCHYYCNWRADNHVYSRLHGLVTSYLMTGEPWFLEVAEQMGGHLVRAWDGDRGPRDTQTRSAYPARGLVALYEVTGHRSYWHGAVDLVHWVMQTGMQQDGAMRGFANDESRISPLYAGYTMLGLAPVYERCRNGTLLTALRRCGEWLLTCQGDQNEGPGAGTWPRDTLIWGKKNLGPGNCGATTLCAELQTFLAQQTGCQAFFYSGAAAWANLVTTTRHDGVQGGLPMQAGDAQTTGTWSYTFPIYLHRLPAVAQQYGWPFVVEGVYDPDPRRASPVVVFVAAGGRFDEDRFVQPLYADNRRPVSIQVWCPKVPHDATFAGSRVPLFYESRTRLATVTIPAAARPGLLTLTFR